MEDSLKHAVHDIAGLITLGALTVASACAEPAPRTKEAPPEPSVESITPLEVFPSAGSSTKPTVTPLASAENPRVAARFDAYLADYQDLTFDALRRELHLPPRPAEVPLPFDPSQAKYFDLVTTELQMTQAEREHLQRAGVVTVDHAQAYSMASLYFAIYARDLPVLITTDSILHALHRSYDDILVDLETGLFGETITTVLAAVHDELGARASTVTEKSVRTSLEDVDLYVTVARNLLVGAGAAGQHSSQAKTGPPKRELGASVRVPSKLGLDDKVAGLLGRIASLRLEVPESGGTRIYGGMRPVDYSQFRPRGHYTQSETLRRYFRTLMWLGRADTGFILQEPDPGSGLVIDVARERRNAAVLASLLASSQVAERLASMSRILDFMVGGIDNLGPEQLANALKEAHLDDLGALADDKKVAGAFESAAASSAQQIRSQVIVSDPYSPVKADIPALFQLFGQRFLIDSFALSQVVFDAIVYRGKKQKRWMPQGLDVMAALGNNEAVRLLEPELETYRYAANLLAVRRVVEDQPPEFWRSTLYNAWLAALRTLDNVPEDEPRFPAAMRGVSWSRKQLQTQLASWAELRHDTLLYGKQSYTAYPKCAYPDGFVEPYPEFFATLSTFAREAAGRFATADVSHPDAKRARQLRGARDRYVKYFRHFESVMGWLETIAKKELAGQPLSPAEGALVKKTIDIRGRGSGPPRYDGWYPTLIFKDPAKYKPTVADVHTNPRDEEVLEVGTGSARFLVVAIDNDKDKAIYVGPSSSYYEFTTPVSRRLTDEDWHSQGAAAGPPPWTEGLVQPPVERHLGSTKPPRPGTPRPR